MYVAQSQLGDIGKISLKKVGKVVKKAAGAAVKLVPAGAGLALTASLLKKKPKGAREPVQMDGGSVPQGQSTGGAPVAAAEEATPFVNPFVSAQKYEPQGYNFSAPNVAQSGMSPLTMGLIGVAGLAALFLLKGKKS